MSHNTLIFRQPNLSDGLAIYQLIKACPPLDLNSSYLYFLQASHFAETCMLVEEQGVLLGFVSAYFRPDVAHELFVWQVAVAPAARGKGLAKRLLQALLLHLKSKHPVHSLSCTISPSNRASQGLFKSLAQQYQFNLTVSDFISASHFGGLNHEAEQLYSLTGQQVDLMETIEPLQK